MNRDNDATNQRDVPATTTSRFTLPDNVESVRTTPTFDHLTIPEGLTSTHQLGAGAWGVLRVQSGVLSLIFDDELTTTHVVAAGQSVVIPPESPHHVTLDNKCVFLIEFFRAPPSTT